MGATGNRGSWLTNWSELESGPQGQDSIATILASRDRFSSRSSLGARGCVGFEQHDRPALLEVRPGLLAGSSLDSDFSRTTLKSGMDTGPGVLEQQQLPDSFFNGEQQHLLPGRLAQAPASNSVLPLKTLSGTPIDDTTNHISTNQRRASWPPRRYQPTGRNVDVSRDSMNEP